MKFYLYILKSLKDGNFYTGMTSDLEKRLKQHNAGKTPSTKPRRPFVLIYSEEFSSREDARKREIYLKSYAGSKEKRDIIKKVENCI